MTAPTKPHVFLSHHSADKPFVEEFARRLRKEGLEPWLDITLEGHTGWVNSVAFHPSGLRLVTGSSDKTFKI